METRRITRLTRAVDEGPFQLLGSSDRAPGAADVRTRPRCEILLRLPDEHGGVETPDSFLPHAERYRLIPAIDRWVVRQTVALLGAWHRDHPECELPLCSINLSVPPWTTRISSPRCASTWRSTAFRREALCFEIAEAAALGNFAQLVRLISEIRATGCGLGLDDFGSGLASFAHLKALPVDYVKIGGHYVRRVAEDPVYGTLVSAVNEIGRIMGITTIAEEVESETVLQKLRALGVEYAQGHAVAPPAPLVDDDGSGSPALYSKIRLAGPSRIRGQSRGRRRCPPANAGPKVRRVASPTETSRYSRGVFGVPVPSRVTRIETADRFRATRPPASRSHRLPR